jgi:hypothetical protein
MQVYSPYGQAMQRTPSSGIGVVLKEVECGESRLIGKCHVGNNRPRSGPHQPLSADLTPHQLIHLMQLLFCTSARAILDQPRSVQRNSR